MDMRAPAGWGMISLALCEDAAVGLSSGRVEQCSLHGALSAEVGIGKDCSSSQQPTLWVPSVAVRAVGALMVKTSGILLFSFFFLQGKYWPKGSFLALSVACSVYMTAVGSGALVPVVTQMTEAQVHMEQP